MTLIKINLKELFLLLGTFQTLSESKKICPFSEIVELQKGLYNNSHKAKVYFPIKSCYVCANSTETVDYIDETIKNVTLFGPIPLYNNILEFGVLGIDFPKKVYLFAKLNNRCNFKVQIIRNGTNSVAFLQFLLCIDGFINCPEILGKYTYDKFKYDSSCIFFSFRVQSPTKIYYAASTGCLAPSSNVFSSNHVIEIENEECIEETEDELNATFFFDKYEDSMYDGVVIIMPCSSGGYAVDPSTGRFALNEYCESTFGPSKSDPDSGLEFFIEAFFDASENYKFPVPGKAAAEIDWKPFFIGDDGQPKTINEMAPMLEENKEMEGKRRRGCQLVEDDYSDYQDLYDYSASPTRFIKKEEASKLIQDFLNEDDPLNGANIRGINPDETPDDEIYENEDDDNVIVLKDVDTTVQVKDIIDNKGSGIGAIDDDINKYLKEDSRNGSLGALSNIGELNEIVFGRSLEAPIAENKIKENKTKENKTIPKVVNNKAMMKALDVSDSAVKLVVWSVSSLMSTISSLLIISFLKNCF